MKKWEERGEFLTGQAVELECYPFGREKQTKHNETVIWVRRVGQDHAIVILANSLKDIGDKPLTLINVPHQSDLSDLKIFTEWQLRTLNPYETPMYQLFLFEKGRAVMKMDELDAKVLNMVFSR